MKFDKENERLINKIKEKYPKADNFYRHSFQYVTYSANDGYYYRFFDKDGELIVSCLKSKADFAKVKAIAENEFNVEDPLIELGYGYNNPCYVIDQEDVILLIDFDTYEVVYYLKENLV